MRVKKNRHLGKKLVAAMLALGFAPVAGVVGTANAQDSSIQYKKATERETVVETNLQDGRKIVSVWSHAMKLEIPNIVQPPRNGALRGVAAERAGGDAGLVGGGDGVGHGIGHAPEVPNPRPGGKGRRGTCGAAGGGFAPPHPRGIFLQGRMGSSCGRSRRRSADVNRGRGRVTAWPRLTPRARPSVPSVPRPAGEAVEHRLLLGLAHPRPAADLVQRPPAAEAQAAVAVQRADVAAGAGDRHWR